MFDTSFGEKPRRNDFRAKIIALLLVVAIFFVFTNVLGATIFEDDFNSYFDGDLNGQGSWAGSTPFQVQATTTYEGAKAVECITNNAENFSITKIGTEFADGRTTIYLRANSIVFNYLDIALLSGDSYVIEVDLIGVMARYYQTGTGWVVFKDNMTANAWHKLEIEWRSSDNLARYKMDEDSWTAWEVREGTLSPDRIKLVSYGNGGTFSAYYDYIAENPFVPPLSILEDDFESYPNGSILNGQDNWDLGLGAWRVNQSKAQGGLQSVSATSTGFNWTRKHATAQLDGIVEFYMLKDSQAPFPCHPSSFQVSLINDNIADGEVVRLLTTLDSGTCKLYFEIRDHSVIFLSNFGYDIWHKVQVEWRDNGSATSTARYHFDDQDWTSWQETESEITGTGIGYFDVLSTAGGSWDYLDTISSTFTTGIVPILEPEKPIDCHPNVVDYSNVEVKGKITIPHENPLTFRKLIAHFQQITEEGIFLTDFEFTLPNLKANQSYNYDATSSLPETAGYLVYYWLEGYNEAGQRTTYTYKCETSVAESYPIVVGGITIVKGWEVPILEDCSALTGVEKWLCELKNLWSGVFVPSASTTANLKGSVEVVKGKFPMNYLTIFSDFFDDVKSGVNETSTIPFKILGQTGAVSMAFWDTETLVGGITQKLSHLINNFLTIFVVLIFMFWSISFLRRIFR